MFTDAAQPDARGSSTLLVVAGVLLIAAIVYTFGGVWAVMKRANKDYKTTKAAVPKMRKAFWVAWRGALKIGGWVILAAVVLVVWVIHDVSAKGTPTPAASTPAASTPAR